MALGLVGRRGRDFFARRGFEIVYEQVNLFAQLSYDHAQQIARRGHRCVRSGEVDSVHLAYNEFKSVMVQNVVVEQLLPIPRGSFAAAADAPAGPRSSITSTSRSRRSCSRTSCRSYVEVQVFRALLESNAAFYAAQMTAMDAATRNSGDMIEALTLYMNKVRQAAITREIIEVVSGAQAL